MKAKASSKKWCLAVAAFFIGSISLYAGGRTERGIHLVMATGQTETQLINKAFKEVVKEYNDTYPGATIEYAYYPDYEATMKTKMAANDLPDLFETHGWSVMRYSEYLEPLTGQSWASKVNPMIKPVITDSKGQIYTMPFDVDICGLIYNEEILEMAGVDPRGIRTMDDFLAACAKVKAIGKIPVDVAGGGTASDVPAAFQDVCGNIFFITSETKNYRREFANGTFNWSLWRAIPELLLELRDKNYLNPDYTQGTIENTWTRLGNNEVAFCWMPRPIITAALAVNPKARLNFIPFPSVVPGDSPTLITGELYAYGVWKGSTNKNEALKFLEWCSTPAIINKIAAVSNNPTGLVGPGYEIIDPQTRAQLASMANVRGFAMFDRVMLPGGMWNVMCNTGTGLLAGTMTIDQAVAAMRDEYNSLRAQQ